jgi:ketosteroid isomerase-like protein
VVNAPANRVAPNRHAVFDLIRQGRIHYSSFEATIEHIRVDSDLAIVMGAETVRPTGKAPLAGQTVNRRYTHVWRKGDDGWRLIARHANLLARPAQGAAQ